MTKDVNQLAIAVILPCLNEAQSVARVIEDFRHTLPGAKIYVYDNNSSDNTRAVAEQSGAIVKTEMTRGKGNVVRRAFAQLEADIYVMADGDGTYDAGQSAELINLLHQQQLDMVVAARVHTDHNAYRSGHQFGNKMFNLFLRQFLGAEFKDIFSGFRVFSRSYVKSFPSLSQGFETETEMSLHALELKLPVKEVDSLYGARAEGTQSKLNTLRDGFRILNYMMRLIRYYRPLLLFGSLALIFMLASLAIGVPVILEYFDSGLVERFPTAIAAASLMIIASVFIITGLILDGIAHASREQKRLAYLQACRYRS